MSEQEIQLHKPYRLHATFLLSEGLSVVKGFIFPIILMWVVNANSDSTFILIAKWGLLVIVAGSILLAILQWFHFRYQFNEQELHIRKGGLNKKEQFIRYHRIQNVSKTTNIIGKLFRVTTLKLETEASSDATIHLKMVKRDQANAIQTFLEAKGKQTDNELAEQKIDSKTHHYTVTNKELMKASFTSFSILALIPILITIFFNVDEIFSLDGYLESTWDFLKDHWIWLAVSIIILLIISSLFGIVTTFLQYGRFEVRSDNDRIYIKKGLLQVKEISLLKSKVQGVSVSKTIIRRWFGIAKVRLMCAGGEGEGDEAESAVIFPFLSIDRIPELLPEIIPGFTYSQPEKKLPRRALWVKLLRPSYFWMFVSVIVFIAWSHLWYVCLILLLLIILNRLLDYKYTRYQISDSYTQVEIGGIFNELTTTGMKKIEEVTLQETWLQRRAGLASLQIATRGKPVEYTFIKDIPREEARSYYLWFAELIQKNYQGYTNQQVESENEEEA